MIKLCVEDYCQNCTDFEPDVETYTTVSAGKICNQTNVSCEHRQRCKKLVEYLRKEANE